MALCRFSHYQCDLYIYESRYGIECHVAASRHVNEPEPIPTSLLLEDPAEFHRLYVEQLDLIETLETESIDLPHAGESHTFGEWSELLEFVTELKESGYQVPDWVIEAIHEEMAEETADIPQHND